MDITKIKANPNNPRIIKDDKFRKLVQSIKEFPEMLEKRPIIVNKDFMVLGGNMRLKACLEAGMKDVPVMVADWSEEKQREFIIKDNVSGGEWDWDALANEWDTTKLEEWGLDIPAFAQDDQGEEDNFEIPDEVKTEIQLGDLIEIGPHRLLCGDSRDLESVRYLMNGKKADMVFTDPPYGVSIGAKNRMLNSFQKAGRNLTDIEDDSAKPEDLKEILLPAFKNIRGVMDDSCTVFVAAPQGGDLGMMMMMMMKEAGLPVRHVLIWKKNAPTFSMGRLDYDYQHEPILLTWGKRHKYYGKGQHKTSIWEIDKPRSSKEHPTMKPVELVANAILNNSKEKDTVIDFYLGSGTTMVACNQLDRVCYGIEITPKYCQVIIDRMLKQDNSLEIKVNGEKYTHNSEFTVDGES